MGSRTQLGAAIIPLYPYRQSVFYCGAASFHIQHIPMDYPTIAFLLLSQCLDCGPRRDNIGRVVVDARYCAGIFPSPILPPLFIFYTGSMKKDITESERQRSTRTGPSALDASGERACQHFTVKCSTMETPAHE